MYPLAYADYPTVPRIKNRQRNAPASRPSAEYVRQRSHTLWRIENLCINRICCRTAGFVYTIRWWCNVGVERQGSLIRVGQSEVPTAPLVFSHRYDPPSHTGNASGAMHNEVPGVVD